VDGSPLGTLVFFTRLVVLRRFLSVTIAAQSGTKVTFLSATQKIGTGTVSRRRLFMVGAALVLPVGCVHRLSIREVNL
jgi:hypothetical protein